MSARPTPVFPAVASTMVDPGFKRPCSSAFLIMPMAARSFTLPPGFRYSSLANTSGAPAGTIRRKWSIGVLPTNSVMFSATGSRDIADFLDYGTESDMVKPTCLFLANLFKTGHYQAQTVFLGKLTESLEQRTVKDEQVILPYSPGLLKLSQYLWSSFS